MLQSTELMSYDEDQGAITNQQGSILLRRTKYQIRKMEESTPHRGENKASFKKAGLKCLTNGYLMSSSKKQTKIIFEAKASEQKDHEPQVLMQETYEIVTSILNGPPTGLSKDR